MPRTSSRKAGNRQTDLHVSIRHAKIRRRCGGRAPIDCGDLALPQSHIGRRSMSSPLDRDFGPDEPSPYAPKWVRDAADARRGKTADQHGMAPKAPENLGGEDFRRYAANPAAANEPVLVDRYRLPPSLEPTLRPGTWPG